MAISKNGRKPVRLSLTMVVRDCAKTLAPLLKQVKPYVDEIIIVLGGKSSDNTEAVARKYADVLIPIDWENDWAKARNLALKEVTGEFFLWLDGDDELVNPERLPEVLDAMDERGWDRADFVYNYAFDKHGNVLVKQQRERICRTNKQWSWKDRCHEWLHAELAHNIGFTDYVAVNHRREILDEKAGLSASKRNLPILLEMYEEDPQPRHAMHIGHAYFGLDDFDNAQYWYEVYLDKPESDVQQWNINCQAARCCMVRRDFLGMKSFSLMAVELMSQYKDPYILLAHAAWFGDTNAQAAWKWLEIAKASDEAPLAAFVTPLEYTINVWDIEHRLHANAGRFEEALKVVEQACAVLEQEDAGWKGYRAWYGEALRTQRCRSGAITIVDEFVRRGDITRAEMFLNHCLPLPLRDDPAILRTQTQIAAYLNHVAPDNAVESYTHVDNLFEQDTSKFWVGHTPRVQWYIERLKARGVTTVLEVGCHIGDVTYQLAEAGFQATGIDFNPNVIKHAKQHPNATYRCAKLEDLATEKFDAVLFAEVLEHQRPSDQMRMLNLADEIAPLVLGSVPAEIVGMQEGLYEAGRLGDDLFRPHIFEFDENDMSQLILTDPSRRVVNNHKIDQPDHWVPGFGNRAFEYDRDRKMGIGVTLVLGPGLEQWSPRSIDTGGIGGSETAAVRLAEEMADRGHLVTVYANENGIHNGVLYRHWTGFDPKEEREVVIYSRLPDWIDGDPTLRWHGTPNARLKYLWCHDMGYPTLTAKVVDQFDGVIVMSEWHKGHFAELYPWLDMEKVHIIGNAIKLYEPTSERQAHRFVFSSSPDRGLNNVLRVFPFIREMWPDAELHAYYGWEHVDIRYRQETLRDARQDGVFIHDRIGQQELAEEFARAQFWLYPSLWPDGTDFLETFCITAIEAQAYGCMPVTRAVGALPERISEATCVIDQWTTENILARLTEWDELEGSIYMKDRRVFMRENAETYTWKSVADKWLTLMATEYIGKYGELVEA